MSADSYVRCGGAVMGFAEHPPRVGAGWGWLDQTNYPPDVGPPGFRVDLKPDSQRVRVCTVGEVDLAAAGELQANIIDVLDRGFARVVVDLRDVRFLDSTAIQALIKSDRHARELGARLSIILGGPAIRKALALAGVLDRLDIEARADGHIEERPTPRG